MADTKIEWCDKSWNPIAGCSKCSPGCLNCYAERMAKRLYWMGMAEPSKLPEYMKFKDGWKKGHIECCEHRLNQPLHWRKPRRIFVCSMSDLFHLKVPWEFIDDVSEIMFKAPQHTYLILTKRVKRMAEYFSAIQDGWIDFGENRDSPPPFIHLGVSISNQAEADEKIPILLQIPAAVRWLSIEPMLEDIDLANPYTVELHNKLRPWPDYQCEFPLSGLHWVVVGCESGPGRRPCNYEWAQSIVNQCDAANVPVFVKQMNINGEVVKMPKEFPQELPERR